MVTFRRSELSARCGELLYAVASSSALFAGGLDRRDTYGGLLGVSLSKSSTLVGCLASFWMSVVSNIDDIADEIDKVEYSRLFLQIFPRCEKLYRSILFLTDCALLNCLQRRRADSLRFIHQFHGRSCFGRALACFPRSAVLTHTLPASVNDAKAIRDRGEAGVPLGAYWVPSAVVFLDDSDDTTALGCQRALLRASFGRPVALAVFAMPIVNVRNWPVGVSTSSKI